MLKVSNKTKAVWQIINLKINKIEINWLTNKITNLKKVAVNDTYIKDTVKLKNMYRNNILTFLRPLLEDKVEKMANNLNENFQWVLMKYQTWL